MSNWQEKIQEFWQKIWTQRFHSLKHTPPSPTIPSEFIIRGFDFRDNPEIAKKPEDLSKETDLQKEIINLQQTLQKKEKEHQAKTESLQQANDLLQAKLLAKQTAHAQKKQNLDAYYAKKKAQRRALTLNDQVAAIVGEGDKWLPHSSTEPKSHIIGKPPGKKGKGRKRPEIIHETVDLHVHTCTKCGADLTTVKGHFVYTSVITELYREQSNPKDYQTLRLKNVLQRHERKRCLHCRQWNYPQLGLLKNCRFGLSFVTFVISQRIEIQLPYDRLIQELQKIFGSALNLSITTIIDWFLKFEDQLHAMYDQLAVLLKNGQYNNIDESGCPMQGENWWLWAVCSANIALYKLSASRGHESVEDLVKDFKGTIIADFFRAYDKFDQEQQKCLAHLLSDIIELIVGLKKENGRIDVAEKNHEKALIQAEIDADPNIKKSPGRPAKVIVLDSTQLEQLTQKKVENFTTLNQAGRLCTFFRQPFHSTPLGWKMPPESRITPEQAQEQMMGLIHTIRSEGVINHDLEKLLDRCEKYKASLFTYLKYDHMPPDNNGAERSLRKYAVQRRVSGGFNSPALMNHYAVYLSLFMTCKINGKDFDLLLQKLYLEESLDLECFLFDSKP